MGNDEMKKLLVIGGAPKSGTTSLYRYLSYSDEVTPSVKKELGMLNLDDFDAERYFSMFPKSSGDGKIFLEATPNCLEYANQVLLNLEFLQSEVKFVFVLRNPVDLFYSFFRHRKNKTEQFRKDVSFDNFVDAVIDGDSSIFFDSRDMIDCKNQLDVGLYSKNIRKYFESIGGNVFVCFFEQLERDAPLLVKHVCDFVGMDDAFASEIDYSIENKNREYRNVALHKLVHKVVMSAEPFLNRHPPIRKILRSVYVAVNDKKESATISDYSRRRLTEYFDVDRQSLRRVLQARGFENFPDWC